MPQINNRQNHTYNKGVKYLIYKVYYKYGAFDELEAIPTDGFEPTLPGVGGASGIRSPAIRLK